MNNVLKLCPALVFALVLCMVAAPCAQVKARIAADAKGESDPAMEIPCIVCGEDTDWGKIAIITGGHVHFIFSKNSLSGDAVAQLSDGAAAEILLEDENWYFVKCGIYRGFLKKSSDILTGRHAEKYAAMHFEKQAIVKKNTIFIHGYSEKYGRLDYIVGICAKGEEIDLGKLTDDGYLVTINGVNGVVSMEDLDSSIILKGASEPEMYELTNQVEDALGTYEDENSYDVSQNLVSKEAELYINSEYEDAFLSVVNFAKLFLGRPYVWGGEDLMNGVDCSGFIMKVYEHFGISLPHSSYLMRSCGEPVTDGHFDAAVTCPGDIICYDGHVALYMGDGKIIHAANRRDGIKISDAAYRDDIICVRRMAVGHGVWSDVTDAEFDALCRIVEAEAGGCSLQEKIYVADVVLNRVMSSRFVQKTIIGVIMAPKQFQPVTNGRYWSANPSAESKHAVKYALSHIDSAMGALYFMNPKLSDPDNVSWFERELHYLFTIDETAFFR